MNPVVSAAKATGRAVVALVKGKKVLVDEETVRERIRECQSRPHECYDAELGRCRLCCCIVRAKASMATESCPRGFWYAVTK